MQDDRRSFACSFSANTGVNKKSTKICLKGAIIFEKMGISSLYLYHICMYRSPYYPGHKREPKVIGARLFLMQGDGFTSGFEITLLDFDVFVKTSFECVQKVLGKPFNYFACSPCNWNLRWKRFLHESLANVIFGEDVLTETATYLRVLHDDGIQSSSAAVGCLQKEVVHARRPTSLLATYKVEQTSYLCFVLCANRETFGGFVLSFELAADPLGAR